MATRAIRRRNIELRAARIMARLHLKGGISASDVIRSQAASHRVSIPDGENMPATKR